MQYKIDVNVLAAKLDHGTNLFDSLKEIFDGTQGVMIVSGIGMLKDFELGYFDSEEGEYQWKRYSGCMELLSLSGSYAVDGSIHLHAVVSGEDHIAVGGHLKGGLVHNVVELSGLVSEGMKLQRRMSADTGTKLLSIE